MGELRMAEVVVTVFGGSGFLGRYVVRRLAASGAAVRAAVRDPEAAMFLKPMGGVGQISLVQANLRDQSSVEAAVAGASAVVNLVGIATEHRKQRFDAVHTLGAERVAKVAAAGGARHLVHVSAMGADQASPSVYARTKAAGEKRVREAFPSSTILRPSVVFGFGDEFFNRFAILARCKPGPPLIGGGNGPRMQPVYAGDVADAVVAVLARVDARGKVYELGGPEVVTLREILELVIRESGRRRFVLPLPWWVGSLAAAASAIFPLPPALRVTFDQLRQLRIDNVADQGSQGLAELGVPPTPMAAIMPEMLARFRL